MKELGTNGSSPVSVVSLRTASVLLHALASNWMSFSLLPPEVLVLICRQLAMPNVAYAQATRDHNVQRAKDLTIMMTVSKTTYAAAALVLYSYPYVCDPLLWLGGALLGMAGTNPPQTAIPIYGKDKLRLLGYTKHLVLQTEHYVPKGGFLDDDGSSRTMDSFNEEDHTLLMEDAIKHTAVLDDAMDIVMAITATKVDIFPNLETIQVGTRDWDEKFQMAEWMIQEQGAAGCSLLRKLRPKYWCQFSSGGVFCHPSTRPIELHRRSLPKIFTAHTNIGASFVVLWGTVNHIYIMESIRSDETRADMGQSGTIDWLATNIITSYPSCFGTLSGSENPIKDKLEESTTFIVHNLVPSPAAMQDNPDIGSRQNWHGALCERFQAETSRELDYWQSKIKVLSEQSLHDICPRCGAGCA